MNSLPADHQPSGHELSLPPQRPLPHAATVDVPAAANFRPAANEDVAGAPPNDPRNPLWIITIGMACFFGTAAIVMALR